MSNSTQNNTTQRIVMAALLAALTCVATMIIKIPSPLKGYLNVKFLNSISPVISGVKFSSI